MTTLFSLSVLLCDFFFLKLPGEILLSSDFTFDFAPTTLLSYYFTEQKSLLSALYFYSSNEEASVLLNAITQMR